MLKTPFFSLYLSWSGFPFINRHYQPPVYLEKKKWWMDFLGGFFSLEFICYSNVCWPLQLAITPFSNSSHGKQLVIRLLLIKTSLTWWILPLLCQRPLIKHLCPAQISSLQYVKICKNGMINSLSLFLKDPDLTGGEDTVVGTRQYSCGLISWLWGHSLSHIGSLNASDYFVHWVTLTNQIRKSHSSTDHWHLWSFCTCCILK